MTGHWIGDLGAQAALRAAIADTEDESLRLALGVVVLVVVLTIVLTAVRELPRRRRARAEARWAAERSWQVLGGDRALVERLAGMFGVGGGGRVSHLIAGWHDGRPAGTFEYAEQGATASVHCHVVSVVLPVPLPGLRLTPQAVTDSVPTALGGQDIAFESEDFNRAWRVRASDAKFAHDVLHPRMMERLLAGDAQGLSIWILGTELLCWVPGGADLEAVDERLAVLDAIVDAIPRFVWLEHGYDPGVDLEADVPVPAQALASRTSRRPLVSATARAVDRDWSYIIGTTLSVLVTTALTVVLVYIGAAELATMTGVLAAFLILGAVGRSLIGRSRRKTRGRP